MVTPDYYKKFKCIGADCKNNCCKGGWDIEIDDESFERFKEINGEFGELVMSSINTEHIFIRQNGSCPLLSPDGWCEMVQHGEKLCVICDEYPRFTEDYDGYTERGISLSCEAAAQIIIDNDSKLSLTGDTPQSDDEFFNMLYSARNDIIKILEDRSISIAKRIRLTLNYGEVLQAQINNNDYSIIKYTPVDNRTDDNDSGCLFDFLKTLDVLDDKWLKALDCKKQTEITDDIKIENIALYFVYRYFLKSLFDCDALSKLKFMAVSVIAVNSLIGVCGNIYESARLYSIEIEHNEDNIEAIYDEFLFNDDFSTQNIINMIK